jgi:tetratricopeptide (TPR) repeat protein
MCLFRGAADRWVPPVYAAIDRGASFRYTLPVAPPDEIPLEKAVARELIPCSVCGAKGADVRQVEGKKYFLCEACLVRGRKWTRGVIAGSLLAVAFVGFVVYKHNHPGQTAPQVRAVPTPSPEEMKALETKITELVRDRKFFEAQKTLIPMLEQFPQSPILNLYMGRFCYMLGQYELSLQAWAMAARDPQNSEECRFRTGEALQSLGYSSKAKSFFEKPFSPAGFEETRNIIRAEILIDLEEYDQALKILESLPRAGNVLFYRHRALSYQGKGEEARKVFDGAPLEPPDRIYQTLALAGQAREEGDFAGALKILEEALSKVDPKSIDALRIRRSRLSVYFESGNDDALEKEAAELIATGEPRTMGESLWTRALSRLAAGKRDLALADAKELLQKSDHKKSWLRQEILTMEHLTGRFKDEDIDREARAINRFRANDLYFYLALATGKAEWAEKALAATPGHNFPYHSIKRFLKGK